MRTIEAVKFFQSQSALARLLNTNQSTVGSWGEYPPKLRQLQIEALSGGALKAEANILPGTVKRNLKSDGVNVGMHTA